MAAIERSMAACVRTAHSMMLRWMARQHDRAYSLRAKLADEARNKAREWFSEYLSRCYTLASKTISQLSALSRKRAIDQQTYSQAAIAMVGWLHAAAIALEEQVGAYINTEMTNIERIVLAMLDAAASFYERMTSEALRACVANPATRPELRDVAAPPYTPSPMPTPQIPEVPPEVTSILGVTSEAMIKESVLK